MWPFTRVILAYIRYRMGSVRVNTLTIDWQCWPFRKVRKRAKIRNRYNQAPHLIQNTNGKVTTSQLDISNESQEVKCFQAGDHKASIKRRTGKQNKTEIT